MPVMCKAVLGIGEIAVDQRNSLALMGLIFQYEESDSKQINKYTRTCHIELNTLKKINQVKG